MDNKFITLGCRLNTFESEIIKEQFSKKNIKNKIVINTCAVTEKAERNSLRQIKKLKKLYPNKEIIVTGCAVHTAIDKIKNITEDVKIIDNTKKMSIDTYEMSAKTYENNTASQQNLLLNSENNKPLYSIPVLNNFNSRTRAYLQIQQGCDHRCSFCIINKTRGKSISLSYDNIIHQVKKLVKNGYKEITLTGVDISSWNRNIYTDQESNLGKLCVNILKEEPKLHRLRLSSLDPAVEDSSLLILLKNEERFMPHLHLSLQSMNNNVLNNMGRRHSKESAIEWIIKLKNTNKNLILGADIICGFPKETNEHFLDTYNTLKQLNIPLLHVFPYSERVNTPAAKMIQLPNRIRKERTLKLIELSNILKKQLFASKIGKIEEILIENNNLGYTRDYLHVKIENKEIPKNTLIQALIINNSEGILIGESINV